MTELKETQAVPRKHNQFSCLSFQTKLLVLLNVSIAIFRILSDLVHFVKFFFTYLVLLLMIFLKDTYPYRGLSLPIADTLITLLAVNSQTYPYRGPSLPIADTMITLLAVSSQTYCYGSLFLTD